MATYFVDSSAAGAGTGADWTNAFTTYGAAVAAATVSGDIIKVHVGHTEELAADTTYTYLANVFAVCVDKNASDALAVMGTSAWIGNSTVNRSISLQGAFKVLHYGLTFRLGPSATLETLALASSDNSHQEFENCYLWNGNTNSSSVIRLGGPNDAQAFVRLVNCTMRFGHTGQWLQVSANVVVEGGSVSALGSAPTNFILFNGTDPGGATISFEGFDASALGSGALVGDSTAISGTAAGIARFANCKLGTGFVMMAAQTNAPNRSSGEIWVNNCSDGDVNTFIGYANALGSVVCDSSIFFTTGDAGVSWKIVTTANASLYAPFITPWIDWPHTPAGTVTPYLEILRDGSSTAFKDNEVWGSFSYQGTSGFPLSTIVNDRATLLSAGADQAAGAGTGSWTGASGTAWSGKLAPNSAVTPLEVGHLRGRVVAGAPSITVRADPQLRT